MLLNIFITGFLIDYWTNSLFCNYHVFHIIFTTGFLIDYWTNSLCFNCHVFHIIFITGYLIDYWTNLLFCNCHVFHIIFTTGSLNDNCTRCEWTGWWQTSTSQQICYGRGRECIFEYLYIIVLLLDIIFIIKYYN